MSTSKPEEIVAKLGANAIRCWLPPKSPEDFPETKLEDWKEHYPHDFGIAFSGGGLRAATQTLGWMRAFNELGLIRKAKYIAVNSGASWVTMIAIFAANAKLDSDDRAKLESVGAQSALQSAVVNGENDLADCQFLLRCRQGLRKIAIRYNCEWALNWVYNSQNIPKESDEGRDNSDENFWIRAVREFMTVNGQLDPKFISANDNFPVKFKKLFPMLIVAGAIKTTKKTPGTFFGYNTDPYFLPFEFTPIYCGIPINVDSSIAATPGFVEPFAFNCDYKGKTALKDELTGEVYMQRMDPVGGGTALVTMADVSGVSSSAVVEGFYEQMEKYSYFGTLTKFVDKVIAPKFHYWSPRDSSKNNALELVGTDYVFSDGGTFDNTCALNLFRRQVKNVIICNTNNTNLLSESSVLDQNVFDLQALFGRVTKESKMLNVDEYNKIRQVFDRNEWDLLLAELKKLGDEDKPLVIYRPNMKINSNPLCGVPEYTANVLFVFNYEAGPKYWPNPANSKAVGAPARPAASTATTSLFEPKSVDSHFPYIPVSYLSYDKTLVKTFADLSYCCVKNSEEVTKFIEGMNA